MTPEETKVFLAGCFGSFLVELLYAYKCSERGRGFPKRYRTVNFWVIRFLVIASSGTLCLLYEIDSPKMAVQLGAATPLIVKQILDTASVKAFSADG